jgi:hypothetical protein
LAPPPAIKAQERFLPRPEIGSEEQARAIFRVRRGQNTIARMKEWRKYGPDDHLKLRDIAEKRRFPRQGYSV